MTKIAFIGLGNMGGPMAANLATAGYRVAGFDPASGGVAGVELAPSATAAVQGADCVITMLPNGAILQSVVDEVLAHIAPGSVLIDCSTVAVDAARAVAAQCAARGVDFADAPVSGGIGGAKSASLTFMVGGGPVVFDRIAPILDAMGKRRVACGAAGAGQAAKICNNMILGVTMASTCEAFVLARALHLDPKVLYEVVSSSSGQSWSMTSYCPAPGVGPKSPADQGYEPGFAASLMLKDMSLAADAALSLGAETPLGHAARNLYAEFVAAGGGGRDFSGLLPWLDDAHNTKDAL